MLVKSINSQTDFDAVFKAENAILFILFPLVINPGATVKSSNQCKRMNLVSRSTHPNFNIHLLAPDAHPFSWKWVNQHAALADDSGSNSGTLLWLRRGVVVAGLQNPAHAGVKTLSRITDESAFSKGKQPGWTFQSADALPLTLSFPNIPLLP